MSPEELREAIAKAIYLNRHRGMRNVWHWASVGLDIEHPGARDRYLAEADAALAVVREAMREPSRAMCDMGWSTERGELPMTPRDVWLQMLAASPLREPGA